MSTDIIWSRDLVRVTDTHFTMAVARRRYRREPAALRARGFRAWARHTYNGFACTGKLTRVVGVK